MSDARQTSTPSPERAPARGWRVYADLTKARLSMLVLLTTLVGFVIAQNGGGFDGLRLLWTLVGTALAAGSANAFNQVIEIARDASMHRTRTRPLPAGTIGRTHATVVAALMGVTGLLVLWLGVGALPAALALISLLVYVAIYTPLKTRSTLNTLVGAVCGALPPMIGWSAATGGLEGGAWALGGLLFVWQIPHFLALAWLYREDYERGRYAMLPLLDRTGRMTAQIVVLTSLMLIPIALTTTLLGLAGWTFTLGSIALGGWMGWRGLKMYQTRSDAAARRVFLASLVYLSTVMILLVADRGPVSAPTTIHQLASSSTELPVTIWSDGRD
jgi:protoheme IX farnesyltransferase